MLQKRHLEDWPTSWLSWLIRHTVQQIIFNYKFKLNISRKNSAITLVSAGLLVSNIPHIFLQESSFVPNIDLSCFASRIFNYIYIN